MHLSRIVGAIYGVHPRTVRALPPPPDEPEPGLADSVRRLRSLDPFLFFF